MHCHAREKNCESRLAKILLSVLQVALSSWTIHGQVCDVKDCLA